MERDELVESDFPFHVGGWDILRLHPKWLTGRLERDLGTGVKNVPASARDARDAGSIPGSRRSPGEGNGSHSHILAWRIPWTEEPAGPQSKGLQRAKHRTTNIFTFTFMLMTACFIQWTCHKLFNHYGNFEQKVRQVCQFKCYFLHETFLRSQRKKFRVKKVNISVAADKCGEEIHQARFFTNYSSHHQWLSVPSPHCEMLL